jgi:hypothetical protein
MSEIWNLNSERFVMESSLLDDIYAYKNCPEIYILSTVALT